MTLLCRVVVPGRAVPWSQPRIRLQNNKAVKSKPLRQWQATVAQHARLAWGNGEPYAGPVAIGITVTFDKPPHADAVNAAKAIEDAMQGVAIVNDKQTRRLDVEIEYGPVEGAVIEVHKMGGRREMSDDAKGDPTTPDELWGLWNGAKWLREKYRDHAPVLCYSSEDTARLAAVGGWKPVRMGVSPARLAAAEARVAELEAELARTKRELEVVSYVERDRWAKAHAAFGEHIGPRPVPEGGDS